MGSQPVRGAELNTWPYLDTTAPVGAGIVELLVDAGLLVDTGVEAGVVDTVLGLVVDGAGTPPPEPAVHDATDPPGAV